MKKITDRVYKLEKKTRKRAATSDEGETPKKRGRPKRTINLEYRYPRLTSPNDDSDEQQNERALEVEMAKERPRRDTVLLLMKQTFFTRRQYILHNNESVVSKLAMYPGLKMPVVVSVPPCE